MKLAADNPHSDLLWSDPREKFMLCPYPRFFTEKSRLAAGLSPRRDGASVQP